MSIPGVLLEREIDRLVARAAAVGSGAKRLNNIADQHAQGGRCAADVPGVMDCACGAQMYRTQSAWTDGNQDTDPGRGMYGKGRGDGQLRGVRCEFKNGPKDPKRMDAMP